MPRALFCRQQTVVTIESSSSSWSSSQPLSLTIILSDEGHRELISNPLTAFWPSCAKVFRSLRCATFNLAALVLQLIDVVVGPPPPSSSSSLTLTSEVIVLTGGSFRSRRCNALFNRDILLDAFTCMSLSSVETLETSLNEEYEENFGVAWYILLQQYGPKEAAMLKYQGPNGIVKLCGALTTLTLQYMY